MGQILGIGQNTT